MFDPMTTHQLARDYHQALLKEASQARLLRLLPYNRRQSLGNGDRNQPASSGLNPFRGKPSATY
jgi:hypothetical protein